MAFTRKYFHKYRLLKPEGELWEGEGTKICKLRKSMARFLLEQLDQKPGNGKCIHLQKYHSPMTDLMASNQGVLKLSNWLEDHGINHLIDISSWYYHRIWCGWRIVELPTHLHQHQKTLIIHLKGFAPIETCKLDKCIWLGGKNEQYIVKDGYALLINNLSSPLSIIWEKIWNRDGILKVNIFYWEMVHEKILIAENLKKRNIQGPSNCVFCARQEESIKHLFYHCPFSMETWRLSLMLVFKFLDIPLEWNEMFIVCRFQYPIIRNSTSFFMCSWMVVTKYLCQTIWLCRNQAIFQDKRCSPENVAIKGMQLIFWVISSRGYDDSQLSYLNINENNGLEYLITKIIFPVQKIIKFHHFSLD